MTCFLGSNDVREQDALLCGFLLETQLGEQGDEGRTDIDTEKLGMGGAVLCLVGQHQLGSSACLTMRMRRRGHQSSGDASVEEQSLAVTI